MGEGLGIHRLGLYLRRSAMSRLVLVELVLVVLFVASMTSQLRSMQYGKPSDRLSTILSWQCTLPWRYIMPWQRLLNKEVPDADIVIRG